jgi:uncharacterized protein HemX
MTKLKLAWWWVKDNAVAVLGFVAVALGFILYRKWKTDQVNTLKDAVAVSEAEKTIAVLEESKKAVDARVATREVEINRLDKELETNKRRIVEARTGATDLSGDEVLEEYRRLGYLDG